MERPFRVVGPDRGGGWLLMELVPRLVGGTALKAVRRYGTQEEAEAERDAGNAARARYVAERVEREGPWRGTAARAAAALAGSLEADLGDRFVDEIRGGW